MRKKCFSCNRKFPLFFFSKDKMKYQRPSDHKRVKCCRFCNYLKWSKDGEGWFFDYSKGKFTKEIFNSKIDVLKRVLE